MSVTELYFAVEALYETWATMLAADTATHAMPATLHDFNSILELATKHLTDSEVIGHIQPFSEERAIPGTALLGRIALLRACLQAVLPPPEQSEIGFSRPK